MSQQTSLFQGVDSESNQTAPQNQTQVYPSLSADSHSDIPATAKTLADASGPARSLSRSAGPLPLITVVPKIVHPLLHTRCYSRFEHQECRIRQRLCRADDQIIGYLSYTDVSRTLQKEWAFLSSGFTNRAGNFCNRSKAKILFDLYLVKILIGRFNNTKHGPKLHARLNGLTTTAQQL